MMRDVRQIKAVRKHLGMTQVELSKISGVSQSLIAKIELGRLDPAYSRAQKLFSALDEFQSKNELKARDVMHKNITTLNSRDSIKTAVTIMKKKGISQLPVTLSNQVVGSVTESKLLTALIEDSDKKKVSEVMDEAPPTVSEKTPVKAVINLLKYFPMVIVMKKEKPVGIITKSDVIGKLF